MCRFRGTPRFVNLPCADFMTQRFVNLDADFVAGAALS